MQKCCKLLCMLCLFALLFPLAAGCAPSGEPQEAWYSFSDSAGYTVSLPQKPTRVAVMLSSFAELWQSAGGEVAMTVGESIERGILPDTVTVLAEGAGKSPSPEAVIAAEPNFVILSADLAGHVSCAAILRDAGIPVALLRVECFDDYLAVLKIFTDINERPELYERLGLAQKAEIDALVAQKPLAGKRILFARAASGAVKGKSSAEHFAAAMLTELGAVNIADGSPLSGEIAAEAVLAADPDYLVFCTMGNEQAAKDYTARLLDTDAWQALSAVQDGAWSFLPRDLFHYKPNARWAEAYAYLADMIL